MNRFAISLLFILTTLAIQLANAAITANSGQAYIDECLDAGVPVPVNSPMFGDDWERVGVMKGKEDDAEEFIEAESVGEIWIYRSQATAENPNLNNGVCLALPRYDENPGFPDNPQDGDEVSIMGIICMEKNADDNNAQPPVLNSACFFDTPSSGPTLLRGQEISIVNDMLGGADLANNGQGICSDCHAGENPFVVHPEIEAFEDVVSELYPPTGWHDPIVPAGWPENPGPITYLDEVPSQGSCVACHSLPDFSNEQLPDYCSFDSFGMIQIATRKTMPPAFLNADSSLYNPHIGAINSICSFPEVRIDEPDFDVTARAGAYNNPGKILVQVNPPVQFFNEFSDFTFTIGGIEAETVSAVEIGRDIIFVLQAPEVASPGEYDLQVSVSGAFASSDTSINSVRYDEEGIPVDLTIVSDVSGSMGEDGKLDASKNAARLWVDHAGINDRIGVVTFASGVNPEMPLTGVETFGSTDQARQQAKGLINNWTAGGTTAMGEGILSALQYFETNGRPESQAQWRMALLTDGKENTGRLWTDEDQFVKNEVLNSVDPGGTPHKTHIDFVFIGRGLDNLAEDITTSTDGDFYHIRALLDDVYAYNFSEDKHLAPVAQTQTPGSELGNYLAEVYKTMAEKARLEQRIGDWNGILHAIGDSDTYTVDLESGLPEVLIAVNTNRPEGRPELLLNGETCLNTPNAEYVPDYTHIQCRIITPPPGTMQITVRIPEPPPVIITQNESEKLLVPVQALPNPTEYKVMVSAYSHTTIMPIAVDDKINQGEAIRLLVFIGDNQPILNANIAVELRDDNGVAQTVSLYDDGQHGDGAANDGFYGNVVTDYTGSGSVHAEIIAVGTNHGDSNFFRKDRASIYLEPRLFLPVSVYALESLIISDRSSIVGSPGAQIYAGNYFEQGADSVVYGNVEVNGAANLRERAALNGDLSYASTLSQQNHSVISGDVVQQTAEIPVFPQIAVVPGTQNLELANDQSATWEPGRYGDAIVRARSTLILKEGQYHFRSLNIEPDAKIYLESASRNTLVLVENNLQFGNGSPIFVNNTAFATFYTNTSNQVSIGTDLNFNGTVIAPNATVQVFSRSSTAKIAAKNIRIEPDAQLNARK